MTYASFDPQAGFEGASNVYRRMVGETSTTGQIDRARLRVYFEARSRFEARRFDSFDKVRLDQLREDQRIFAGETFEASLPAVAGGRRGGARKRIAPATAFGTHLLASRLMRGLSPVRFEERRARNGSDTGTD